MYNVHAGKYKIGIDIGGTNTDCVLIDTNERIVSHAKTTTTADVHSGVKASIVAMLKNTNVNLDDIIGIFIGTTQIANAIHQREDLYRVGVIRIAGHHPVSIPSCFTWPADMKKTLVGTVTVDGGYECDGDPITMFQPDQVKRAVDELIKKKAESLAVIGVFASINSKQEILVKEIINDMTKGKMPVSLSHMIGGTGFIERENSTILNAALKKVMLNIFRRLVKSCAEIGLVCPIWITQNNGSVLDLTNSIEYPVLTISAGPTNSFIGGIKLAKIEDAIVIDIGGTSTDVGIVYKGNPRRCLNNSRIGGITLNFSMPDVHSVALGGGSHIQIKENGVQIGPQSCGSKTFTQAQSFGGSQLTLTDVALVLGHLEMPGARPNNVELSHLGCKAVMNESMRIIYDIIARLGPETSRLPIIMIGGGSALLPKSHLDDRFVIPPFAHVANAYGAALAEISATIDTIVSLENRELVLEQLQAQAIQAAIQKGADFKKVTIADLVIIPYNYVPNKMARVIVRASGKQPLT